MPLTPTPAAEAILRRTQGMARLFAAVTHSAQADPRLAGVVCCPKHHCIKDDSGFCALCHEDAKYNRYAGMGGIDLD